MLSNHSQLRAVWISPYINIILEVSLYKCTHQCCIYHLYRHLRIHSKKSASRYAVQMKVEKSRTKTSVVYRQGRSTIFRMPIYPMLNQCPRILASDWTRAINLGMNIDENIFRMPIYPMLNNMNIDELNISF